MSGHGRDRPGEAKLSTLQRADSPSELYKSRGNDVKLGYMQILRLMGIMAFQDKMFSNAHRCLGATRVARKSAVTRYRFFLDDLALETTFVCAADFT